MRQTLKVIGGAILALVAVTVLVAFMYFVLVPVTVWGWNSTFGDDGPSVRESVEMVVDDLDDNTDRDDVEDALREKGVSEREASRLARAIVEAKERGASNQDILDALEDLDEEDFVSVRKELDKVGKAPDTAGPTATVPATPSEAAVSTDTGTMPSLPGNGSHGAWKISTTSDLGTTDPVVSDWLARLEDPAPALWKTFPNIPNPDVAGFRVVNGTEVPDGAEYGVPNVPYCQQDNRCDAPVPAWHYRLITGNYEFLGQKCGTEGQSCLLIFLNVGDTTYTWKNLIVDNGFTVPGRYWNGDALEWATWGLVSHASANMLNMPTMASEQKVLNSGNPGNAGANCSKPNGCKSVEATVVVHAGDRILAVAKSTVSP